MRLVSQPKDSSTPPAYEEVVFSGQQVAEALVAYAVKHNLVKARGEVGVDVFEQLVDSG